MRLILTLVLLTATAALGSGCGGDDDDQQPQTSPGDEAREYVGTVDGVSTAPPARKGQYFVAVTFNEAGNVLAYVCDGTGSGAQLFEGKASGDKLDLTSNTGDARLTGTVTDGAVEGEVTIAGRQLAFTTKRAEGIGGLYTVARQAGGETAGRSVSGNTLGVEGTPPNAAFTVTTADGKESVDIEEGSPPGPVYSEVRAIILDSGARRGQKTVKATRTGGSTNFTCPYLID